MIRRFEGTRVLRRVPPTKASDPSALAAAELIGRAKRVPRLAVRRARESCIVSSRLQRCPVLATSAYPTTSSLVYKTDTRCCFGFCRNFPASPRVRANPATRSAPRGSRGTASVRRLPSLIIDDDQSLRRLNAIIRRLFVSGFLQEHDTVKPCGKLAGFVPQRRRWPKIS